MPPVLGGEVVEGEQLVFVVDDLGNRLRPLGPVVVDEGVDGLLGRHLVLGAP